MELTFLGKETQGGGSPTLFETDRNSYVVQGWRVTGHPSTTVEIPASLLGHLPPDAALGAELIATGRRWQGDSGECETLLISGDSLDDVVLAKLDVPDHEACIEVQRKER
ncbi:hypothetical protein [Actinoplanes subglobosus]|uniref:Uncharacterized protein n=1 Tax=Actinoplanes subglobosus TaxID=1547892 RepID=A0ABV8J5R0_9ACTN